MPILTVTNLTGSAIPLQDTSGMSSFSVDIPPHASAKYAITLDQMDHLEPLLIQQQTAGKLSYSVKDNPLAEFELRLKFTLAAAACVHMLADDDFVTRTPLAGSATLSQACTFANGLRVDQLEHYADAGASTTIDAAHLYVDTVNQTLLNGTTPLNPSTATLTDLTNFIIVLNNARLAHGFSMDVTGNFHTHFHDDADENLANLTFDPTLGPLTLPHAIQDLNDLQTFFIAHFARASE